MKIRTWQAEVAVVGIVLAAVATASGRVGMELIGSVAVLLTFCHAQIADRLAEKESQRASAGAAGVVECHSWARRYFVSKELCWLLYFAAVGAWSAITGVALFLAYPAWRRFWRTRHPLAPDEPPNVKVFDPTPFRTTPDEITEIIRQDIARNGPVRRMLLRDGHIRNRILPRG